MRAILALLWREYRELRWSVLTAIGILLAWPLVSLCRGEPRVAADHVMGLILVSPVLLGLFFGMRAAAGERAGHTATFVSALPVHPATLGLMRLLATAAAVLLPVLCLAALSLALPSLPAVELVVTHRFTHWGFFQLSAAAALHMALVVAVCGAGARTELRAGARGLTVLCGMLCLASLMRGLGYSRLPDFGLGLYVNDCILLCADFVAQLVSPLGVLGRNAFMTLWTLPVLGFLAAAFVWRYRAAVGPVPPSAGRPTRARMPATLRSPSVALALKTVRAGALPLATIVPVAGLAVVPFACALHVVIAGHFYFIEDHVVMAVGAVVALLLGIAAFATDLDDRLNTFWRSRPIPPTRWFWTTYIVALVPLLLMLGLPIIGYWAAAVTAPLWLGEDAHMSASVLREWGMVAMVWAGSFAAGVLAICLVRRPLLAGILALGLIVAVLVAVDWFVPWDLRMSLDLRMSSSEVARNRFAAFAGGMLAMSVVGTVAAWWAANRDIAIIR